MPSPFPGMDPYLEQHWRDVHASLIVFSRGQLRQQLPGDLVARIEERVFVESGLDRRPVAPDVRVVEFPSGRRPSSGAQFSGSAVAEPVLLEVPGEEMTETHITIIEKDGGQLVTSIEFLSPTNKVTGEGRRQFLKKRKEMLAAKVNIVEIDLVREGERDLILPYFKIPPRHSAPFQACVWRPAREGALELYAFPLQLPLPSIRIPLRPTDEDVYLDLQALVRQCYEEGDFYTIDYSRPPDPPLEGEDAAWAAALVKGTA